MNENIPTNLSTETSTSLQKTSSLRKNFQFLGLLFLVILIATTAFFLGKYGDKIVIPKRSEEWVWTDKQTSKTNNQPELNTFYLGNFQDKEGIYLTGIEYQDKFINGFEKIDPLLGVFRSLGDGAYYEISFHDLTNPKKIGSAFPNYHFEAIEDLEKDVEKNFIYISLPVGTGADNQFKYGPYWKKIFQISLNNFSIKEVWSESIGTGKHVGFEGPIYIKRVIDKYLVILIPECEGCETTKMAATVINIETGKEKYLGEAGNVNIDLSKSIVTYQKLSLVESPCTGDFQCSNGKTTSYKPTGEILTESLP